MSRVAALVGIVTGCGRIGFELAAIDETPVDATTASCTVGANVRISNAAGQSAGPALVSNGTGFAIAWSDDRDGNVEVYLTIVDPAGAPITGEVRITDTAQPSTAPSIGWSGTSYGILWAEAIGGGSYQIRFQQVSAAGVLVGSASSLSTIASGFVPSRTQRWIDSSYAVTWQADAGGGNDEVFFARLAEDGAALTADIQVTTAAGGSGFPSLASTGTELGVAWNDDRDGQDEVYFTRLDPSGQKLGGDVRVTDAPGASFAPTIEWTGMHFALTWWDNRSGTSEIYFAALDGTGGRIGPEVRLDPDQYGQVGISSWSGTELGVVWADFRNDILEPYFARLDADGIKLGDDVRVSTGGIDMELDGHTLTADTDRFAIAWADRRSGDVELYLAVATCP